MNETILDKPKSRKPKRKIDLAASDASPLPQKILFSLQPISTAGGNGRKREPSSNHTSPQMRHSLLGEVQIGSIRLFAGAQ